MSLYSIYPPSSIASSSRHALRPAYCSSPIRHQSTTPKRTDELRQRPLPLILSTLRQDQTELTFPPGSIKALALRYDRFGMSPGFRDFINVDVPRIKYANPHIHIRPWLLSSIPYPPATAAPSPSKGKQREQSNRDNIPRIVDEPEQSGDVTKGSSDSATSSSTDGAPSGTSFASETEEEESTEDEEEHEVETTGEILPDPLEVDGGKWRDRFKAAKDEKKLLPSEVIIEYTGRPPRTILFSGDDSAKLIDQIMDIVHDREVLVESPESPDFLAIDAGEVSGVESANVESEPTDAESPVPREAEGEPEGDKGDKQAARG